MSQFNLSELDVSSTKSLDLAFSISDIRQLQLLINKLTTTTPVVGSNTGSSSSSSCNVISLDLSSNKLGDEGCKIIAQSLLSHVSCTIGCLKLNNNKISDVGLRYLVDAVVEKAKSVARCSSTNSSSSINSLSQLSILTLGDNLIGDSGVRYMCDKWLLSSSSDVPIEIIDIDLDGNVITDQACRYLVESLEKCTKRVRIESVTVMYNEIKDQKLLQRLETICERNQVWNSESEAQRDEATTATTASKTVHEQSSATSMSNRHAVDGTNSSTTTTLEKRGVAQNETQQRKLSSGKNDGHGHGSALLQMSSARKQAAEHSTPRHTNKQNDASGDGVVRSEQMEELLKELSTLQRSVSTLQDQVRLLWRFVIVVTVALVLSLSFILISPWLSALLLILFTLGLSTFQQPQGSVLRSLVAKLVRWPTMNTGDDKQKAE